MRNKKIIKRIVEFAEASVCIVFLSACSAPPPETEYVLGTICTVNLYEQGSAKIYSAVFSRLHELENILSANADDSNIAEINRNAGIKPVVAAPETITLLNEGIVFSKKTNGIFDPTIGPLVKAWNIGTEYAAVPSLDTIQKACALINFRNVVVNQSNRTIFLTQKDMKLDLGAIAKGYAADEIVNILKAHTIKRGIIDLGGNIFAYGEKASGKPWTVGIKNPEVEHGEPILSIPVKNTSVVTSGIYERFFESNGKRYHHILDPRTGFPAENDLLSVTIISPVSMIADALSTSVFLLGREKGMMLVEQTPDTEVIFIDKNRKIFTSSGLKGKLSILNEQFTLAQ